MLSAADKSSGKTVAGMKKQTHKYRHKCGHNSQSSGKPGPHRRGQKKARYTVKM